MAELSKGYEPRPVESKWYQFWLDRNCFVANPASPKPAYSIVMPPPNVTGVLTLGHVLNNTIQDILARKARMEGKEVLWLPGTDHAGIATQTVVERTLKKQGLIRHRNDLGREKFLEKVWEWKEKHGGIIIQQLKQLGCSCDWTRERFTMDAGFSRAVAETFVDLYKKGLIYRGKRMVNWCPASLTALSDEEVTMKEQIGVLYYFKVEVAGQPGTFLTIATTRPETIPGDTAIAVNPKDGRYAKFIGQRAIRPLPPELPPEEKLLPIIGDEHVDFEFGTGVLKVTPAHDPADFDIGRRHQLAIREVINADGTMNQAAGRDLAGLDRFAARKAAVEKLKELGALEREETYKHNVGFSERADVPIEPRLSEQWFLKYPSQKAAREVVASGQMKFFPDRWAKVYDHWMGGLQDWCISRQLWWGHRIPVWIQGAKTLSLAQAEGIDVESFLNKLAQKDSGVAYQRCPVGGAAPAGGIVSQFERRVAIAPGREEVVEQLELLGFTQDPDVLDTWFSAWLWAFATMDEPTRAKFYPTSVLVTAPEIIFFWVARMIFAGFEYTGQMPFRHVYFTGIIRDKLGRKMSKSLGNSPDPLDLIAKYGADALRLGIMRSAPLGQDIIFDEQHVELGRNFCNKLWNACRFRQMQGGETQGEIDPNRLRSDDKWVLLKLNQAIREITQSLAEYKFHEATQTLYRFFWSEYCDWYVEVTKAIFLGADAAQKANTLAVMDFVLSHTLRLLHPFLPFITEELWHGMGYHEEMPAEQGGQTILFAPWPRPFEAEFRDHYSLDDCYQGFVNLKFDLITQGRNLRREANISANKKVKFVLRPANDLAPGDAESIKLLLNAETFEINPDYEPKKGTLTAHTPLGELYLPTEGLIDVAAEKARLAKELEKVEAEIVKAEQKLNNPAFVQKVPPPVLQEHKKRLADWQSKRAHLRKALADLGQS